VTELVVARSTAELAETALTGRLIAGGTDILVQIRAGREVPRLVDVSNLSDPPPVLTQQDGVVEISALAPISRVIGALEGRLPSLAASSRLFGSIQIRNRATIGGNLANASPAADMLPPLVAAGATVAIDGRDGRRDVLVADLAAGPGRTVLAPGEWISSVRVPLPEGQEGFRKLGGREAMAISIVSLAWRWRRAEDGTLTGVRIALGAVAPTVTRSEEAERALEGRRPADAIDDAVEAVRAAVAPIDDVRGSAWYRREVAGRLLEEALRTGERP
jgi:CO/xanthine dehydrogenase FAD-binding subunit